MAGKVLPGSAPVRRAAIAFHTTCVIVNAFANGTSYLIMHIDHTRCFGMSARNQRGMLWIIPVKCRTI